MNAAAIVLSGNDADSSNPTRGSRKKFIGIGCDIAVCRSIGPLPPLIYEMTVKSNDAESMHLVGVGGRRRAGAGNGNDHVEEHFLSVHCWVTARRKTCLKQLEVSLVKIWREINSLHVADIWRETF